MLPSDPKVMREAVMRWTGGNIQASAFLMEIAEIARLADDIVDEDENRQRNVAWLLTRTMIHLPANEFYRSYAAILAPMISSIIVQWEQSDEWRSSRDALKRTFGFVMREAVGQIVTAVASILHGYEFAKTTADDFFETCHAGSRETIEDWVRE